MANTKALKPINVARRYRHIRPVPRMPNFAAWIEGVDLTQPLGTAIQITVTPPAGGNTCWCSTSKAYDWLSPGMQKYLEGLQAVHSWEVSGFRNALAARGDDALIAARRSACCASCSTG